MKVKNLAGTLLLFVSRISYAQEELVDIKDPILFVDNIDFLMIIIILLIVMFLVGIFFFAKRWLKNRPVAPIIRKTPSQIAFLKLSELKSKQLPQNGRLKEYFTLLADILRRYIEDQFNVRAPEMTTEEFLNSISREYKVDNAHMELLRDFLTCCDMVKFAKYDAQNNEVDNTFESAMKFINETKGSEEAAVGV